MADKIIGALTATAAVLLTDKVPKEPTAGPPAEYFTLTQLKTLLDTIYAPVTGGAYVLKAGDTMTGLLTIAQATANTSNLILSGQSLTGANAQSLLSMAGTWNTTGNPSALKIAITNTASGATSKFLELLAGAGGATSVLTIDKAGAIVSTGKSFSIGDVFAATLAASAGMDLYLDGANGRSVIISTNGTNIPALQVLLNKVNVGSSYVIGWSVGTVSTTADTGLARTSAGLVQINNGTAGTLRDLSLRSMTMATAGLLSVTSGTNQRAGNLTLVGGALTVANTTVTNNSVILLTRKATGGTIGFAVTYTVIATTSFTVTSDNALDTSTYSYLIIEVP